MFETFIALGIIVSLIYHEATDLSPGGLITPGYLALFITQPSRLLSTFLVAILTALIIKELKNYLPVYGRRQFAVAVSLAILLKMFFGSGILFGDSLSVTINSIGVIVPGLIANDMVKQSVWKTTLSITFVTLFLTAILFLIRG